MDKLQVFPNKQSSWFSQLFFCWAVPLFYKTLKKANHREKHKVASSHESNYLSLKTQAVWQKEITRKKPSLWRVLRQLFWLDFLVSICLCSIKELVFLMAQPWLIGKIMQELSNPNKTQNLYIYTATLIACNILTILVTHRYQLKIQHVGMKIRICCCSLIYQKALQLNSATLADVTLGKIINLISNDVNRFDLAPMHLTQLFIAPIETFLVIALLYQFIGPTALFGIAFLIVFVPVQMYLSKLTGRFRLKTASETDNRMKVINELIQGIKSIKMGTLENFFTNLIVRIRRAEVKHIWSICYLRSYNVSSMLFMNRFGVFLSIVAYVLVEKKLDAKYVFVLSSYYAVLRQVLTVFLPYGVAHLSETKVSVERICKFLLISEKIVKTEDPIEEKLLLQKDDRKFSFEPMQELVVIMGKVGSGKTTVLQEILQDCLYFRKTVSYAGQEPWLFAGTIRDNILFGLPFDKDKYDKVVNACALLEDFNNLPLGDLTETGEGGALLSGGQKSRVSLARAVYRKADIYLLDDPFSCVDAKVANRVFKKCVVEYLSNRCVVLVSNHPKFTAKAHKVYEVGNDGLLLVKLKNDQFTNEENENFDNESENMNTVLLNKLEPKNELVVTSKKYHSKEIWSEYIKSSGNLFVFILLVVLFIFTQFAVSTTDYFLVYWINSQSLDISYIYIYLGLLIMLISISLLRSVLFFKLCLKASTNLHNKMLNQVLKAPLKFFSNGSGEILNRFSKDVGLVDEVLPTTIMDACQILFLVMGSTILVTLLNPVMLVFSIIFFVLFYGMRLVYLASSQNLKRVEAAARGPVYAHVNSTLQGLITIKAFEAEDIQLKKFNNYQNDHTAAFYMFFIYSRAFGFWLDMICVCYSSIAIASMVLREETAENVGLSITQSINLIGMLQWGIRQLSELENQMINVERIVDYINVEVEKTGESIDKTLLPTWPVDPSISFKNVSLTLADHPVLKSINLTITGNQKIGIVGRTGAGKSSLVSSIFRLYNYDGAISIDNINIDSLPLKMLRQCLSAIPQDPFIFTGTLRENLDPYYIYNDEKLWQCLECVGLKDTIQRESDGLLMRVLEKGSNFSAGQKQLICLARAILKENKIIILDEATANVDLNTESLIEKTLNDYCKNSTIVIIAHKLQSIMKTDLVIVMDDGKIIELDKPEQLLKNSNSLLTHLVKEAGL